MKIWQKNKEYLKKKSQLFQQLLFWCDNIMGSLKKEQEQLKDDLTEVLWVKKFQEFFCNDWSVAVCNFFGGYMTYFFYHIFPWYSYCSTLDIEVMTDHKKNKNKFNSMWLVFLWTLLYTMYTDNLLIHYILIWKVKKLDWNHIYAYNI